ncbi:MAG: tetratricopeptide repeat protein [Ardenticatenaceae bacterium]|nr:tetratricopeptide repeat protein [Anaerolineales bacterium]MCB8939626.1 tetratricopeptide repeat protein [Ardenticatenaceae bacterium]MCB8974949.1 tetratricopeptide repeat protein [Ardenticatenaceae bacterium]
MPSPQPALKIHLFGTMQVLSDGQPITGFASRKAEALLAYLLLNPQPHPRDTLADLLWDDRTQKQALGNLRVLLSNLRQLLPDLLLIERQTVQRNPDYPLLLDTAALQAALVLLDETGTGKKTAVPLQSALQNYRGPLLAGLFLRDARRFEEWLLVARERWQQQALRGLHQLALHQFSFGDLSAAAQTAHKLVELDPLRERSQQLLLRVLARQGHSNAALQQYQQFANLLQAELGVPPAPETERLYQHIRQARTSPARPLPQENGSLVGRQAELVAIQQRLDDPATRLVTLLGLGGMGKTRLALAIAHLRRRDYLNGVCFVPLAAVTNGDELETAVTQALGLEMGAKNSHLRDFLRERELLLVLDNVEQLVDEVVDWIRPLLTQAHDVQFLVTSRERLQLREEWALPLSGLPLDETEAALNLLRQRAAQFAPDLPDDDATLAALRHICQLVDGVPLALELAAAALAYHSPAHVADELHRNLDFLRTHLRDLPARHRSMRAVFAHSWQLLTAAEQRGFAQMAVFHGGFNLAAATAVTQSDRFVLESLLAKSLIQRQANGRYSLHELLRQFAAEKLAEDGELETAVRQAHATYFATHLQTHLPEMGAATDAGLQAIAQEFENVQAAWRYWVLLGEETAVQQMLGGLTAYFYIRGLFHPGLVALTQAVEAFADVSTHLRAEIQVRQALFLTEIGAYEAAIVAADEAVALSGADSVAAIANLCRGYAHWSQGNYEAAKPELEQAIVQAKTADFGWVAAQSLNTLGNVLLDQGETAAAQAAHQQALAQAAKIGQQRLEASARINLGNDFWHAGEFAAAHAQFEQALTICQAAGIRQIESLAHLNIGLVDSELGDFTSSVAHIERALALSRKVGDRRGEGNALLNLLVVFMELNRVDEVADLLPDALAVCRAVGDQQGEAMALDLSAHIQLLTGAFAESGAILAETWQLCERIGDGWGLMETRLSQARLQWHLGDFAASVRLAADGLARAQALADQASEAKAWCLVGNGRLSQNSYEEAIAAYEQAIAIWQEAEQGHLALEGAVGRLLCLVRLKRPLRPKELDQLIEQLLKKRPHGLVEPGRVFYTAYLLLAELGDGRTEVVRGEGERFLRETAVQFPAPNQQNGYLHKISFHQALLQKSDIA